jgi:hypothetical protein
LAPIDIEGEHVMKNLAIIFALAILAGCSGMRSSGGSYGYGGSYGSGNYGAGSGPNYQGTGGAVPNQIDPATGTPVPLG